MSEVPISSPYRSTPDAPVTEDERNTLSARINAAFTDGAFDADEYQRRLDQLFAAQTMGQLLPVVEGLPPVSTYASPAIVEQGLPTQMPPGELAPARSGTNLTLVAGVGLGAVALLVVILLVILL